MIVEGQIVLFKFPQTDQKNAKLRPAIVLRKLPGKFDDWLICMISSQLHHVIPELDEIINLEEPDFQQTGLKQSSLIRASRLAVVTEEILIGKLGTIDILRLEKIRNNIVKGVGNYKYPAEPGERRAPARLLIFNFCCFAPSWGLAFPEGRVLASLDSLHKT